MNLKRSILYALYLFVIGLAGLQAQEAITTTGGDNFGNGGSVSYSIGQVVYSFNTGANGSTAQGVQQPFEISVVTSIETAQKISVHYSVYPNPAISSLILKIEDYNHEDLFYQLYDNDGKLLDHKKVTGEETTISLENFVPAIYFLKLTNHHKEIKTFKILKY